MKKVFFLIVQIVLFLFFSCASTKTEENVLNGIIYNDMNEPVSDVVITLDGKEVTVSDIYGHFLIKNLQQNKSYKILATKNGYEPSEMVFSFTSVSQVLYLQMLSIEELLTKAEKAILDKKYMDAENLLNRAEVLNSNYLSLQYLRAVLFYNTQKYDEALSIVLDLLNQGYKNSYIYLFLADIYKIGFSDTLNEKKYLECFLELEYSNEIQQRIKQLE